MSTSIQKTKKFFEYLKNPVVFLVTLIRVLGASYILVDPFWGLILSLLFDFLDAQVLLKLVGFKAVEYNYWDKWVDWMTYPFMLISGSTHGLFLLFSPLLLYRLIGQVIFHKTRKVEVFILFPNFFEVAFFIFVSLPSIGLLPSIGTEIHQAAVLLGVAFALAREIVLHFLWLKYYQRKGLYA